MIKVPLRMPSALPIRTAPAQTLERAFAIGSPLGEAVKSTVVSGIVIGIRMMKPDNQLVIQAGVPILPGNSGGPLLDQYGNLIGISTLTFFARQGIQSLGIHPHRRGVEIADPQSLPKPPPKSPIASDTGYSLLT